MSDTTDNRPIRSAEDVLLEIALLPHRHDVPVDAPDRSWAEKLEGDRPGLRLTRKQAIVVNALRESIDYAMLIACERDEARFQAGKDVMVALGNIVLDFIIDNPNDPTRQ